MAVAGEKAVREPDEDPKLGKPRAKSGVAFPYFDLAQSIDVAEKIHLRAGGECDLSQLASFLSYSGVRNGSFRMRLSAAKMFGLIEQRDDERIYLTSRGQAIVAPVEPADAEAAKGQAFLSVDLFKKVYDKYNGGMLPGEAGLRNLLETTYRVVPDRVIPTVRILLDSAEQAGFFAVAGNRSRMTMPIGAGGQAKPMPNPRDTQSGNGEPEPRRTGGGNGGGGNGGDDTAGIDPVLLGLLKRLPVAGTALEEGKRTRLIAAFTAAINFIYPEQE